MTGNGRGPADTEALREEIRRTRVELGETMEALAAKADVKKRLKSSTDQAKERMREQAAMTVARVRGQARQRGERVRGNPAPMAALAAGALAAVVVLMIVRGRRR
jgi:Flp pilus assembly protein TadB